MANRLIWGVIVVVASALAFLVISRLSEPIRNSLDGTETITITDFRPPARAEDEAIVDDKLVDKKTSFDPDLIDSRPLDGWRVNASEAVIRLDIPMLRPGPDDALLRLYPSYKAAASALAPYQVVLPSLNMIDGKAKQFDDGLVAAIETAYYKGLDKTLVSHVDLIRRLLDKVGPASEAAPYLAAGLSLAGVERAVADLKRKAEWLAEFEADRVRSKPIAFYNWTEDLSDAFRFLRYFQTPIPANRRGVAAALANVFRADDKLLNDYEKTLAFYAKLDTNTTDSSIADIVRGRVTADAARVVALFPESSSREALLFEKLFPQGLPPSADLMRELIRRIRSSDLSLATTPTSGWYDYQVFALETLVLPGRSEAANKLLLTRAYKERLIEAFKALITKRKETHVRGAKTAEAPSRSMPSRVAPRLRVEPCPSYYLRTARAYAFLADFLQATLGGGALKTLHGLTETGPRPLSLADELHEIRNLYYGLYLICSEDLGWKPAFLEGESVEREACLQTATGWLSRIKDDPDLACDTRVSVPIMVDPNRNTTRLWATLGVRMARLDASYARGPRLREKTGQGDWREVEAFRLGESQYIILVDEFAEIELQGRRSLTRAELRAACDTGKTKEAIVSALQSDR